MGLGLYGDSGTTTCSGFPGSEGYETQDADQIAAWGVDYWKYDNVSANLDRQGVQSEKRSVQHHRPIPQSDTPR